MNELSYWKLFKVVSTKAATTSSQVWFKNRRAKCRQLQKAADQTNSLRSTTATHNHATAAASSSGSGGSGSSGGGGNGGGNTNSGSVSAHSNQQSGVKANPITTIKSSSHTPTKTKTTIASSTAKIKRSSSPNSTNDSPTTTNRPVSPFTQKLSSPFRNTSSPDHHHHHHPHFYHRSSSYFGDSSYNGHQGSGGGSGNFATFNHLMDSNSFMASRGFDHFLQNSFGDGGSNGGFKSTPGWRTPSQGNYGMTSAHQHLSDHLSVFHPPNPFTNPSSPVAFSATTAPFFDYKSSSLPIIPPSNISSEAGLFFSPFYNSTTAASSLSSSSSSSTFSRTTFPTYSNYNFGYPSGILPSSTPSSPVPSTLHSLVIFPTQSYCPSAFSNTHPSNLASSTAFSIKPYPEYSLNLQSSFSIPPSSPTPPSNSPYPSSSSCNLFTQNSSELKSTFNSQSPPLLNNFSSHHTSFKSEASGAWSGKFQDL